ncbi:MaoC family dehydratase [Halosimplex pelagicum]|uniref:MaoC family dehydratase n=1 Tax=Halosimplex pelagicum TaxID=869886 RepID=A0A7D5TUQ5_9EURY|nr:MaoC family dehydratase [Halosimplex pelagicum]QLH82574.1 MaoC family dehydratase [Halosimplex pelagicum]
MEYFEDLTVGDTDAFGSYEVTAAEITDFAERYDPQPFHTDPEAAADSPFGGLVASGWHTAAMTMRLLVDNHLADGAARGALGVDELRWRRPVRPDDELTVTTEIVDKDDWDDESGLVSVAVTTEAGGEEVLSMVALVLYERRSHL